MLFILVCIFSIIFIINWIQIQDVKNCFIEKFLNDENIEKNKLEDILLSNRKPRLDKSIFFHETSCSSDLYIKLNARQACAIESAALMNPNFDIFVLFATPTYFPLNYHNDYINNTNNHILNALLKYNNIYLRNVNIWKYSENTPIYEWLKNGDLFKSKFLLSHTSDFLRYLTLWKWGGIYLDMDVIVKKSFDNITLNFAGAESNIVVAAGVLSFDSKSFGHEIADLCLRNFQITFNGNDWGNNGPGVITRVLQEICKTKSTLLMTKERCFGFHVYPQNKFYAIKWKNWEHFFMEKHLNDVLNQTKNSIAIHVWNKHSAVKIIKKQELNVAYTKLAEQYCPRVYESSGEYF